MWFLAIHVTQMGEPLRKWSVLAHLGPRVVTGHCAGSPSLMGIFGCSHPPSSALSLFIFALKIIQLL